VAASHPPPGQESTTRTESPEPYTLTEPSPDGIGKVFMGREIAQVMGHRGIAWLERDNREQEESPTSAIDALQLPPETVIADIGAGSGYYSFRIARLIPDGEVVAVDIQPEMIAHLEQACVERNVSNIRPHLGRIDDVQLEPSSIDAAIMVDAYHEFSHPAEMLGSLHEALRPGGRIYLLEYRAEDASVPIKPLHKMTEAQARKEFEALGFDFITNHDFLPWQHFLVFERPAKE
jgi:FkbM family methyltransferase